MQKFNINIIQIFYSLVTIIVYIRFEGKDSLLGCEIPIFKISTTFFDEDKINSLKDEIHTLDQLHAVSTSRNDLEITHVSAQKGTALLRYAQAKKITPSQILAVGDSGNDLSMLSLDLGITAAMYKSLRCYSSNFKVQ